MADVRVQLDKAMGTSLIMLYGLAVDARTSPTILGDTVAAHAFDKVEYDFERLRGRNSPKTMAISVAARAKHFDDRTSAFLAEHDQATVLHLGAGLDSRVWRVAPGAGVTWYDVDYPDVVDVRRKIFPERDHYHLIGSSVTAPEWLRQIRPDLPTLVIAQGLTMYLQPEEGHALFGRITDHFAGGVVLLDTHNSWVIRRQSNLVHRLFGATHHWAIDSPADLERRNPRLRCTEVVSGLAVQRRAPGLPLGWRLAITPMLLVPKVRDSGLYLRYEFGG